MASFIIKPKNDDHLKLQNDAGNDIVEIKNDDKVLYVSRDSANAEVALESFHDTEATTPKLTMRKSDGSAASPALVDDNAVLGTISFQGNDGGVDSWEEGAKIEARVDGTPSGGTDMPTELTFWTTPDGSATAVERMTIDPAGNTGVNVATAAATKFNIVQGTGGDGYTGLRVLNNAAHTSGGDYHYGAVIQSTGSDNSQTGSINRALYLNAQNADTNLALVCDNGDAQISTGNLVVAAADKGLSFTGGTDPDTAGTATGNILTDYEEGTWTPSVVDDDGDAVTNLWATAFYTKIGRQVTVCAQFDLNSPGVSVDQTDVAQISGLPFTCMNTNNIFMGACQIQRGSYGGDYLVARVMGNTSTLKINDCVSGTGTSNDYLTIGELVTHASTAPGFTVTYFV